MPYFRLNGIEISRYIAMDGVQLSENDLDSPRSGRTLDGVMHRGKITHKCKAEIKLVPVKSNVLGMIMGTLRNEYLTCNTDLFPGMGPVNLTMYNSTRRYGVSFIDKSGVQWYKDASFNLIER